VPVGDDIKPATAEDINLDKILSSVVNETQNNNDEDDDLDFL
jgi:hypothetical protein